MMAADSDGYSITTVVTCEGDLTDPTFPHQLERVLGNLQDLLGDKLQVCKLEPWNSVRVTLSIPREAAVRLRLLASEGSQQLRALGILSVQVEGDQVISLRLAGPEPQEVILRTTQDEASTSAASSNSTVVPPISSEHPVSNATVVSTSEKIQFRSPNVLCPTDTVVPKVPSQNIASSSSLPSPRSYTAPFPFTSMNQAIQPRENVPLVSSYSTPPPPYPGKPPPITISSPLLVNLLQNDGNLKTCKAESASSNVSSLAPSSSMHANGSIVSSSSPSPATLKYSVTASCASDTSSVKDIVSMSTLPFMKKSVTTLKTNSVVMAPINQPVVQSAPTTTSTISNFSTLIKSSHSSVLSSANVTQCNSIVSANSNNVHQQNSIQQNNLLHNIPNSLQSSNILPISSSVRQPNQIIQSASVSSFKSTNEITGSNHVGTTIKTQQCLPNSLPVNTNIISNTSNVQTSSVNRNPVVKAITSFRTSSIPPPYRNSSFEPIAQPMPQLVDITPSLQELKESDLDQLLPSLENDIVRSPPNLPEDLTNSDGRCNYLINPLTGELEPHFESENETEEIPSDIFRGLPSPVITSDEDTNPISRPDTTDQSDSESRSNHSDSSKSSRFKSAKNKDKEKGRDSPSFKHTEKIRLRLKLEKTEPVSPAYVSYINMSATKKTASVVDSAASEVLRVPPLHISLRGRNHAVINKKIKLNSSSGVDGVTKSSTKARKTQDPLKVKKNSAYKESLTVSDPSVTMEEGATSTATASEYTKNKIKKMKSGHEHREQNLLAGGHVIDKEITRHVSYNSQFKERRESEPELSNSIKRYAETNGITSGDKKRRLSHTDQEDKESQLFIVGSTNTGTVTALPTQKPRKDKVKSKESSKIKELNRNKSYSKNVAEKLMKHTSLPIGEIDMEAKFKQRLLEDLEKSVTRPPHRTENLQENSQYQQVEKVEELVNTLTDPPPLKELKDKSPDLIKIVDQKPDSVEKQVGRSPNSGGQGEDSGIESMDALSEKSPNQASQSPHTDISDNVKSKPQVPNILDIEAQLAKMEGLNGEDLNENKHNSNTKIDQCCGLTSALQDSLKQGAVTLTTLSSPILKDQLPKVEVSLVPLKALQNEEDADPQPIRVSPPLYTYSNPDKTRDSESPTLSDSDNSNSCPMVIKSKSLLEQLLIDIPDNQNPSSPSPMTRSLRTRASSKLSSPELSSPVPPKQARIVPPKRKRRESESSNNSVEDAKSKKSRKCSENAVELIKVCMGVDTSKQQNVRKKMIEDSSDSDEPLIEVAGKVRKNNISSTVRTKLKAAIPTATVAAAATTTTFVENAKTGPVKTRSSVRTMPALNTRSKGDKVQSNASILRRKTRSTVSEVEGKRKKDVK